MKYVCFDIGNVICQVDFIAFNKLLSKVTNSSNEEVLYFLNRTQKFHDMGLTHFRDEIADHFNIKSHALLDDLISEWLFTIVSNNKMLPMIKKMCLDSDYKVALLSNIGHEHAAHMSIVLGDEVLNNSVRWFSCEVGARKPSILYYKSFLEMYPEFKGCLYVDDRQENLDVGSKFGFRSHLMQLDGATNDQLDIECSKIMALI